MTMGVVNKKNQIHPENKKTKIKTKKVIKDAQRYERHAYARKTRTHA